MSQNTNLFSLPDLGQFSDPHCLPLFNNYGPNAKAPTPSSQSSQHGPKKNTTDPMVTGTTVIGIKYKDGVMLASDTLLSYGSLARFRDIRRIAAAGNYTLIGGTGEYSDFQYLLKLLDELILDDQLADDGSALYPHSIHSWLTRVLYNRRNKFDPLWGQFIVGGYRDGKSFLGFSDLRGTSYTDNVIATGYGAHIAVPLLRSQYKPDLTKEEARKLLEDSLRIMFYRDARAFPKIQIATVDVNGPSISEPFELATNWDVGIIQYGNNIKQSDFIFDENNRVIN